MDGSPIDILGYFKHAKYVITDTFHGSVMSLITNANFTAKIRGNKNKLYDLLDRFGVSKRIIEDFSDLDSVFVERIDYRITNKYIDRYRTSSMNYLKDCLNDIIKINFGGDVKNG